MIEAKSLSRHYGDFLAVNEVNFQVSKGEIVGLLGPNGAGKTTIMKMLTGYLEPSSGQALVAGIDVAENRIAAQQKIGYLPESSPSYKEMNVYQYLKLVCELRGIAADQEAKAISSALEKTQLKDRAFQVIGTLSKGYQQRVGVAQAIIHQPQVLILDEPTNGLDPAQIMEMRKLIKDLAKDATIILSTHIMQEVEAVCDRVLMIVKGNVAIDSKLSALTTSSRLQLRSDAPPAELLGVLQNIVAVQGVKNLAADSLSLELDPTLASSDEVAAEISKQINAHGWKLYSIAPEQRSLEAVFKEVTGHSL